MAIRQCPVCNFNVESEIIQEYPNEVISAAASAGLPVGIFAEQHLYYVSFSVVKFALHNGPCSTPCIGSYTPKERQVLSTGFHDGSSCICVGG